MTFIQTPLHLWHELTGLDPHAQTFQMDDWDLVSMREELDEALRLDPSEVTATLLLESFTHAYFESRSFTVNELLEGDPQHTTEYLAKSRRLYALLRTPELTTIRTRFVERLQHAIRHYEADRDDVHTLLQNRHALPLLRRDALKSIDRLSVHQFLQGDPDPAPPQYLHTIHRFWNINSLLTAALQWPSGLSLNLIQDPDLLESYFVFVCRNGGTLTIVTDRDRDPHPLHRTMTRRPDRRFVKRAWRHHFPYDLLDVTVTPDEHVQYRAQTGLVKYHHHHAPLTRLNQLEPDQLLWSIMVFDLLVDRFWTQHVRTPELAYTGEMILTPTTLLAPAHQAHLPVLASPPLDLPPLTVHELLSPQTTSDQVGTQPTGHARWMEVRYHDQLSEDSLSLIGDHTTRYALDPPSGRLRRCPLLDPQQDDLLVEDSPYALKALNPTLFHDRARLLADRIFLGRYNLAVQILRLAEQEYAQTHHAIHARYHQQIRTNLPRLLNAIARGELLAPRHLRFPQFARSLAPAVSNILTLHTVGPTIRRLTWHANALHLHGGLTATGWPRCLETGALASYAAEFTPLDAGGLALLCGCTLNDLPPVLQHWYRKSEEPYTGNPILERIDPLEWVVKNPWMKLDCSVVIYLSTRAYRKLQRQYSQSLAAPGSGETPSGIPQAPPVANRKRTRRTASSPSANNP